MKMKYIDENALGQLVDILGEEKNKLLALMNEKVQEIEQEYQQKNQEVEKEKEEAQQKADEAQQKADEAEQKNQELNNKIKEQENNLKNQENNLKNQENNLNKKLQEKENEVEESKRALAEKVNGFLNNIVPKLKEIIKEEMKISPENTTAESIVQKMKTILNIHEAQNLPSSNIKQEQENEKELEQEQEQENEKEQEKENLKAQVKELSGKQDNLKERLERKENKIAESLMDIARLNGQLKAWELCADDPDRNYLLPRLAECASSEEVEREFPILKERLQKDQDSSLMEELGDPVSGGPSLNETNDHPMNYSPLSEAEKRRFAELSGIMKR